MQHEKEGNELTFSDSRIPKHKFCAFLANVPSLTFSLLFYYSAFVFSWIRRYVLERRTRKTTFTLRNTMLKKRLVHKINKSLVEKTIDLLIETSLSFGQQYIIWNKKISSSKFIFFFFSSKTIAKFDGIFETFIMLHFFFRKKGNRASKATTEIVENWNRSYSNQITLRLGSRFLWLIK